MNFGTNLPSLWKTSSIDQELGLMGEAEATELVVSFAGKSQLSQMMSVLSGQQQGRLQKGCA